MILSAGSSLMTQSGNFMVVLSMRANRHSISATVAGAAEAIDVLWDEQVQRFVMPEHPDRDLAKPGEFTDLHALLTSFRVTRSCRHHH
ncbi:MAG: hypothetical protein L0H46_08055 [Brevibacterium sp.]|nr:hypothetical protein [Brevibacterium sp.]